MMENTILISYAKAAFNAYSDKANYLTWDKKPIPTWDQLGEDVQSRWIEAVKAVFKKLGT